jgi:hypothetical protein
MGIKDQFNKLKDNWLIIVLAVLVLLVFGGNLGSFSAIKSMTAGQYVDSFAAERSIGYSPSYYPGVGEDFAPEVEDRLIVKTASLSTEIERGEFQDAQSKVKSITTASSAYVLDENVRKSGQGRKSYFTARYQIKVDVRKYDSVVAQLKDIGEVQSFVENTDDITGSYTNLETEIAVEKERLKRYEQILAKADKVEDQIELSDRIFNQERRIKYLEQRLENMDKRIEYSTISFTMTEKRSEYIDVALVKFSQLVENIVDSFNALLSVLTWVLPWLVVYLVGKFAIKKIRKT